MNRLTLSQAQAIVAENTPAVLASGKRNGLRIGDVRAMGKASTTKVLVLRDEAVCDDADGIRTYPAAEIAVLSLVSRDGKTV